MRFSVVLLTLLFASCGAKPAKEAADSRPNIVLVMTDDQGWAQLGMRGDPVLKTPHLDKLAAESVEFTRFYASPVCSPTRASLMTGRYNYRTGVVDTFLGRSMMAPEEVTVAGMLGGAGYRTGIFGKWHLGDNYPRRAMDRGFQEAVVHLGGGIGQPSDPPGSDYFDPILFRNGVQQKYRGYCTDVYFDEAIRFIDESAGQPFFVYLPTNAPHSPYLVPDSYREPYAAQGLEDKDARIYGMIANIDDNVGRMLAHLDAKGLAGNTIFIFMTDNGPTTQLFTAGLRDQKTSVYEGGVRVPFFLRWPAKLQPRKVDRVAAHIDVAPTLLAAAGVSKPAFVEFDGRDLTPLLTGAGEWRDREIFLQTHRGNEPEARRNATVVGQRYKLVQAQSFAQRPPAGAEWELYDLEADPGEQSNLAGEREHRDRIRQMARAYDVWLADVSKTRGFAPQRIYLGTEHENPVTLTRQDWRVRGDGGWGKGDFGEWLVDVRETGTYDIRLEFDPPAAPARIDLRLGAASDGQQVAAGTASIEFTGLTLDRGPTGLTARVEAGGTVEGVRFAHVRKR